MLEEEDGEDDDMEDVREDEEVIDAEIGEDDEVDPITFPFTPSFDNQRPVPITG